MTRRARLVISVPLPMAQARVPIWLISLYLPQAFSRKSITKRLYEGLSKIATNTDATRPPASASEDGRLFFWQVVFFSLDVEQYMLQARD